MPDTSYDEASRYLSKVAEEAMTHWWLGLGPDEIRFGSMRDSVLVFPKIERICDLIVAFTDLTRGSYPCASIVEFQIEPDPLMFGRLLVAGGMVWQQVKPVDLPGDRYDLMAVVVNLTGRGNCAREMQIGSTRWSMVPREINLEEMDAETVLTDIEAGRVPKEALAFIPLMKKGGDDGIIDRWLDIARAETDQKKRGDYALAVVFANAVGLKDLWERRLEGLTMIEAPIVTEWKAEAERKGVLKGKIEAVLEMLQDRFGSVPSDLAGRIRAEQDLARVRQWAQTAVTAPTLEQFRQDASL